MLCLYLRQSFLLEQECKGQKVVSCHFSGFLFFCGEVKNIYIATSVKFLSYIHSLYVLLGLYLLPHIDIELLFLREACDFLILLYILLSIKRLLGLINGVKIFCTTNTTLQTTIVFSCIA